MASYGLLSALPPFGTDAFVVNGAFPAPGSAFNQITIAPVASAPAWDLPTPGGGVWAFEVRDHTGADTITQLVSVISGGMDDIILAEGDDDFDRIKAEIIAEEELTLDFTSYEHFEHYSIANSVNPLGGLFVTLQTV